MTERMDTCGGCRFFEPEAKGRETEAGGISFSITHGSECRLHAPIMGAPDSRWPKVEATDWCGDFEAKRGQG